MFIHSRKSVITIILFCLAFAGLYAASDSTKQAKVISKHNFRIGFGALPENYFEESNANNDNGDQSAVKNNKDFYTHSLYLNYMYAPIGWLECGVYTGFASRRHLGMVYSDGLRYPSYTDILVSVMPALRVNWLRKNWVNMYSSLAFGACGHWNFQEKEGRDITTFKVRPTAQLLLIGISVGKNLYGFADLFGIGSLGLVSFGIGYKLPSK